MRVYEDAIDDDEPLVTRADHIRIVGPAIDDRALSIQPTGRTTQHSGRAGVAASEQDSTIQLWGESDQSTLADLRVGVVGCGGVGSTASGSGHRKMSTMRPRIPSFAANAGTYRMVSIPRKMMRRHVIHRLSA
jgi:hypothetical protein